MGMQIKVGGRLVTKNFSEELSKMSKSAMADLQQRITVTGNAEGKRFAEAVLAKAVEKAPLSSYREGQSIGANKQDFTSGEKRMAKLVGANLIHYSRKGMRIQMKGAKGRFTKQREVYSKVTKRGSYSLIKHEPGALRLSGRVEEGGTEKRKRWVVSFDTRRTDPYSMMKNFNYAVIQHNDVRMKHSVGEACYLTKALLEIKSRYFVDLSSALKRELRNTNLWMVRK